VTVKLEWVIVQLGRLLGRVHGRARADAALYWLSRAVAVLRSPGAIGCVRIGRLRLLVPLDDAGLRFSYVAGRYEPDVERLAAAILRPGDTAVDVGANIGWHALRFAGLVGSGGRVVAFEPGPRQRWLLERSVHLTGLDERVIVCPQAVGDKQGNALLYEDRSAGLKSSIHAHDWLDREDPVGVELTTLDAALPALTAEPPRLLKIDVEGAEESVLRGAISMFLDAPPSFVIVELSSMRNARDVVELLQASGYEAVRLARGQIEPAQLVLPDVSAQAPDAEGFTYTNVCFRRRGQGSSNGAR
jgi:FkbM family methyltransferase